MRLFPGGARRDGQLVNCGQATVLGRDFTTRRFSTPEGEEIETRNGKILSPPRDIDSDDINLLTGYFREAGDLIEEMFKTADIAGSGIILPAMDVDEKERALRFANDVNGGGPLRSIEGRTLVAEFHEGHSIAPISRSPHRLLRVSSRIPVIRPVRGTGD